MHLTIEETKDGWLIHQDGLDGKHIEVAFHGDGVLVDITSDQAPLNVSIGTPIAQEGT